MSESLLRLPAVLARTGWSRTSLYRRIHSGEFPKPVPLGPRARAWRSSDVDRYIASLIERGQAVAQAA